MKINAFSSIFALLVGLLSLALPASCQSQAGSVAIAAAIRPAQSPVYTELEGEQSGSVIISANTELDEYAQCVANMKASGASYKEGAKDCKDYRKVLAKESTRIANEAADATKASRPMIISGYGRGYSSSYGYSYPRERVVYQASSPQPVAQARPAAVARPAAQPRPAAKPRPAASPRPIRNR